MSSNPAAATIDDQGTIRATGIGGAVIRVSVGSVSADVPVSVTARPPASPSQRPLPASPAEPPTAATGPATSSHPATPVSPPLTLPPVPHGSDDYGSAMAVVVKPDPAGGFTPWGLQVLEISDGRICGFHAFLDTPQLFPAFGLPDHLPA